LDSRTISHYRIVKKLGAGGMGEVYLAEDTQLDRKVAIKFLPPDSAADQQAKKRLIREAKAAAALDHSNICSTYEVGEEGDLSFIVMQYIEGETLASRLQRKPIDLGACLDIAVQVADALAEAHSRGIIHRDIKTANIMLTARHQAKVMDFGLAKVVRDKLAAESKAVTESVLTEPGAIVGTVPYMSPEQISGETIDARSDIFSFGVVLYEMVTGRQPFASESAAATFSAILTREPEPLARFSVGATTELQRIVSKALRKKTEERYQTTNDLMLDLKHLREELEFEAKLERSIPPPLFGDAVPATGSTKAIATAELSAGGTDNSVPIPTAGIERAISRTGWRKLKRGGIALAIIALAGIAIYLLAGRGEQAAIDTIAVLPFVNESNDPNAEYLSDGISDSIINSLSQLPNLRVRSLSSVARYKGQQVDPQTVGREQNVRAVLLGRLTQRGETLAISAELVDMRDNSRLWGQQYNRRLPDLMAIQEEIAREISEKLRQRLTGEDRQRLTKNRTENADAYQLYLHGRYYWNKRTEEGLKRSATYFQQAIGQDPIYALAYSGLADAYNIMGTFSLIPPKDAFPRAKAAAEQALKIDDLLAEPHTSLAWVYFIYEWDWKGAEREFKRAIELNPSYSTAHSWYGMYLASLERRDEALAEMKLAAELDPFSLIIGSLRGWVFYLMRQYDLAYEHARKTDDLDPNFARAHWVLGLVYEQTGKYEDAIAAFQKRAALSGSNSEDLAHLGHAYAIAGKRAEAQKVLTQLTALAATRYVSAYDIAEIYVGLGEKERAFEWLDKAVEERPRFLVDLRVEPRLDPLRSDPRFAVLLRRTGLSP